MKKVPKLPVCTRDRLIVSIERVYTPSTFYMKSAVGQHNISMAGYIKTFLCFNPLLFLKTKITIFTVTSCYLDVFFKRNSQTTAFGLDK